MQLTLVPVAPSHRRSIRRWLASAGTQNWLHYDPYIDPVFLHDPPQREWLVTELDGKPVAFCDLELDTEHDRAGSFCVCVAPSLRGRGIGQAAVLELAAHAHKRGLAVLHANVEPDNTASLAMLRRIGFQPDPARQEHDSPYDAYQLPLPVTVNTSAPPHPVAAGQVYERVAMLKRDGTRWKITGNRDHSRIRITQTPDGRKSTIRYRKLDPKPMGNGRPDRGEHPIALVTIARHYQLVDSA